jgi:hypothetical protein
MMRQAVMLAAHASLRPLKVEACCVSDLLDKDASLSCSNFVGHSRVWLYSGTHQRAIVDGSWSFRQTSLYE